MITSLPKLVADRARRLSEAGIENSRGEVELILCYLLGCDRLRLYLDGLSQLTSTHLNRLDQIIACRATRYPLQYILREAWFYGRRFFVDDRVKAEVIGG